MNNPISLTGGGTTDPTVQAQKLQTALANLANQGANSLAILAKASSTNMKGLSNNLKVGESASQQLQTGIANLANQGSNSLSIVAKSSSSMMKGFMNNLKKGEVGAQELQTGLANLSNQGSNSLMALAKASSKAMNGLINNVKAGTKAVNELRAAINKLESKTITITTRERTVTAQKGYHGVLAEDTVIFAHRGEKVDISPYGGSGHDAVRGNKEHIAKSLGIGGGGGMGNIQIFLDNILMDRHIVRQFNMEVGKHLRRF